MKCLGKSERYERMMDLTVEIDGNIGTLEEALTQFTATETLDRDNKYYCGRLGSFAHLDQMLSSFIFLLSRELWYCLLLSTCVLIML